METEWAVAWLAIVTLSLSGGCGGSSTSRPSAPSADAPPPAAPPEAPVPGGPPDRPLDLYEPDPEAQRSFLESLELPAVALSVEPSPPQVPFLALQNTARGEAREDAAERDVWSAELETGQRATRELSVTRGSCVTVVGQGGLGVTEIDLFLTARSEERPIVIAADRNAGPVAVLGGRGGCVRVPAAGIELDLSARVRAGRGLVLVRVYEE